MGKKIEILWPTPVLNTPDFCFAFGGKDGSSIPIDQNGHPYFFEFVALKGMEFFVLSQPSEWILEVQHPSYPIFPLFLDRRFTGPISDHKKKEILPSKSKILEKMISFIGTPYVWGGNWSQGTPEMLKLYPPRKELDSKTKTLWTLSGVDCSGLLYETSQGKTPRNTSQLRCFGKALPIQDLSINEIAKMLKPLDMILYRGHVLFVLDSQTVIESKSPLGVITRDLKERLDEIRKTRIPQNEWQYDHDQEGQFIIRRLS